jgi:glutathione peroxidase
MGCGCNGQGCGTTTGAKSIVMLGVAAGAVALIGFSVFGFGRADIQDAPKDAPTPVPTPAPTPTREKPAEPKPAEKPDPYVLGFTMKDIDGKDQDLAQYKGKVVVIVNVASECGFTPQYKGLQALYESRKDKGLVILGFPANNFGGQEPGKDEEIKSFCTGKYAVTFPLFSKVSVAGKEAHPLFQRLAANVGEPEWNFNKFLVDKEGKVVQRFQSRVKPDDAAFVSKIDDLLK